MTGMPSKPAKAPLPKARIIAHGAKALADTSLNEAVTHARDQGFACDVRLTWEEGDGRALVAEAASMGISHLIAAGGDGTLHHVAAGIMSLGKSADTMSLGVLPLGTANDFANSAGLASDVKEALITALSAPVVAVDLAEVNGDAMINVATGGFGAKVTAETPDNLKNRLGKAAYVLTGMFKAFNLGTEEVTLSGPDLDWHGEVYAIIVGNGRQAGGGIELCPDAVIDDGLLDVTILPKEENTSWTQLLEGYLGSGWAGLAEHTLHWQVPRLSIKTATPLHFNLDGEALQDSQFEFRVHPGALHMHLPLTCPLLKKAC